MKSLFGHLRNLFPGQKEQEAGEAPQTTVDRQSASIAPPRPQSITISQAYDGKPLAYHYDQVIVSLIPDLNPEALVGYFAQFKSDGNGKINVLVEGYVVGTIRSMKVAEIVSDWLIRRDPIVAPITSFSNTEYYIAFDLYLYRATSFRKMRKDSEAKEFKLIGNGNTEMQDNIGLCHEGEACSVYYDPDKEKYLVNSGLDIGYLPKAAEDFVDSIGGSDAITSIISEIGETDSGKYYVKVYVAPLREQ